MSDPYLHDQYRYQATVIDIYDGDTVTLAVDLGFHVTIQLKFRLSRINAYEVRGGEKIQGRAARDWLRDQMPVGSQVFIETIQDRVGKYGRYLVELFLPADDGAWRNLNDELVTLGHAKHKEY